MLEEYSPLDMFQILDISGRVINKKHEPKLSKEELLRAYKYLILTRMADDKALALQRTGRMGTYAETKGEEAASAGPALALGPKDWVFPSYRELCMALMRGVPLNALYSYFMGNETGSQIPDNVNFFTISVPVGTQIPHAVGVGMASNILKDKIATMVYFGDGGTSVGDFHESMNFAGLFKAPTVFICRNNQYAISLSRKKQTASRTISQKALAYGFPGILVDGNDVLAMYVAAKYAVDRAKSGKGPTLIEAYTYRLGRHTTADDPSLYRSEKEVKEWTKKDPIPRFEKYLRAKKVLTPKIEKETKAWAEKEIAEAIKKAEETPTPTIDQLFDYMYAEVPTNLEEQKEYLRRFVSEAPAKAGPEVQKEEVEESPEGENA